MCSHTFHQLYITIAPVMFMMNIFLHISHFSLLGYSWSVRGEWGGGHRVTQGSQSGAEALEPAKHYRGPIFLVTPLLVLQSPASPLMQWWCVLDWFKRCWLFWKKLYLQWDGIQLIYVLYLSLLSCHSSAELNMSGCSQNTCRLISCYVSAVLCLLYTEKERSITVASRCFCILLVERGGALESCIWFAWRPLLEEG